MKIKHLIKLNLQYYILKTREFTRKPVKCKTDSKNCLVLEGKESPQEAAQWLAQFDIISFDVFDTMILRPFSKPTDLFIQVGNKLNYKDFQTLRIKIEKRVRKKKFVEKGTSEVTLREIWHMIEQESDISKETGINAEVECELQNCYADPYIREVIQELEKRGKKIILISDMYLNSKIIGKILCSCGYGKFAHCYVSCEHLKSKADGRLYEKAISDFGKGVRFVHIGDNEYSDQYQASKYGWTACLYNNKYNREVLKCK